MDGITKVIDELGLIILAKNIELKQKQDKIDKLKNKIETIEAYLDTYDNFYKSEHSLDK